MRKSFVSILALALVATSATMTFHAARAKNTGICHVSEVMWYTWGDIGALGWVKSNATVYCGSIETPDSCGGPWCFAVVLEQNKNDGNGLQPYKTSSFAIGDMTCGSPADAGNVQVTYDLTSGYQYVITTVMYQGTCDNKGDVVTYTTDYWTNP